MLPFLPSVSHFIALVMTLVVAALCIGLGQIVGARRPATALVAGWGAACLGFVVAGGLAGAAFNIVAVALGMTGLAGLGLMAQGTFEEGSWTATARVMVLSAPFLLIAAAVSPSQPDEFSHWLPNLQFLYQHDHFPSVAQPSFGSERPGIPYAMAYVGFAVSLLTRHLAETAGIVWNALLLVAVAAMCADIVAEQVRARYETEKLGREMDGTEDWGIAGIGVLAATLLNPSFAPRLFLSNTDDGAIGSVMAVATASIILWLSADTRKTRDERLLLMAAIGFCCAALMHLRQDGLTLFALMFIAAVAATPLERQVGRRVTPSMMLVMLPPALLIALVWREYQVVQIPDEALAVLRPADWHWGGLTATLWSMAQVALGKPGYFALLAVLIGFALAIADAPHLFTPFQRSGVVIAAVLGLGKIATLVMLYLVADYTAAEAAAAKDFWRFMVQIGPALVVGGITLIPARLWTSQPAGRLLCIAAPVLALVLPIVSVRYLRIDSPSVSHTPYLRMVGREVGRLIGAAPGITLVDPDDAAGDLSALAVVRYQLDLPRERAPRLQTGHPVPAVALIAGTPPTHLLAESGRPRDAALGYPPDFRDKDMAAQLAAPFVWFHDGGPVATQLAGVNLAAGASYLIAHKGGNTEIVASWPFPAAK